jgi:hypothetical protein
MKTCAVCEKEFPNRKGGPVTCSDECATEQRRRKRALQNGNQNPCARGCGRPVGRRGAKGLCINCYQADVRAERLANPIPCRLADEGCPNYAKRAGSDLCDMHRARVRRFGEPGPAVRQIGERGKGHVKDGYRILTEGDPREGTGRRRQIGEHRLVMEQHLGRPLHPFEHVHHRNGVRSDNRLENLELWVAPSKAPGVSARQPFGQRPEDLAAFLVRFYPDIVRGEQRARAREERTGQMRLTAE